MKSCDNGIGIVLFLVFMVLKLCNIIDWSWWWVSAPIWAPIILLIIVLVIVFILNVKSKK